MYPRFLKRLFDLFSSLIGLIILLPLFLLTSLLLLINNRGKIFFTQERPGYKEGRFKVIKFKTMNEKLDAKGNLLSNFERTTKFGSFLRKYSLDEIPQLLNVIIGDMSLVGPRPLLFKYIPLYSDKQRQRYNVKPGITGWAQVNGRNSISWTKKFEFDVYYVEHCSFQFDLKIIFLTLLKVVKSEGINVSTTTTSQPFNGRN